MKYLLFVLTLALTTMNPDKEGSELMKEWKVIKIKGVEKLSSSPTIEFQKEDSKAGGFAGCNNYFSTYKLSGNTLSFGNTGSTRKMCPDMSVENAFLSLLPRIARYEIVKKELYLYDQTDEILITAISQ